ncbi:2-dehydropantoate 2-reductase [Rhodoferax sp.]|uniref:ketopantoate reductase family protein n=1 Tax=Rhodoferax sp. TaxID=50421 RepID=UPI002611EE3A|nr:2-dehydropantoate 2-reductase [Rhodoferax sp.]MDD2810566.1 2-dehydropantoate 2-reductase [Rhodoferax sp.]
MWSSNSPTLSFAVMGAGAVGCFYGGMLARAGVPVTLIGRAAHVQAIQQHGLRLETLTFDEVVHPAASVLPSAVATADVVLFAVKSTDTETTGALLRPHLKPGALVLCLQNGVDNAERLRAVLPGVAVAGAAVYVATEMAAPGHLRHHGRGELILENSPHSVAVAKVLQAAGVPTQVSAHVRDVLWAKLVINCAYNGLSALGQVAYGELVQRPGMPAVLRDLVSECRAVAAADGVTLPDDLETQVQAIAHSMATQMSSTAHDVHNRKPTEIDYLNGHVVRRGDALGVPTPANRLLWAAVKLLENRPLACP